MARILGIGSSLLVAFGTLVFAGGIIMAGGKAQANGIIFPPVACPSPSDPSDCTGACPPATPTCKLTSSKCECQ